MPKLEYIGEAPLNELSVTSSTRKRCRNDVVGGANDNGADIDENQGNIAMRANDSEGKGKGEGKGENDADSSRCGGGIGSGGNGKVKKEKPKKDPNARGVPGTFIFYQNDMRPIIRIELPNLTSQEVASILGKRWQAMTSDEKRSYDDLRNEDKRRHQREIASLRQAAKGVDDDTNARVNRHFDQPECVTVSIIPDKHSPSGGFEKTSPFSHSTISSIHSPANDASANSSSTGKVTTLELESNKENKAGEDDKDLSMFEGLSKRIMAAKSKGGSLAKDASRNIPNHKPTSSTETGSASASEKIVSQLESMKNPVVKLQQFFVEKFTGNNIKATEEEDLSIASSSSNDSIWNAGLPAKTKGCPSLNDLRSGSKKMMNVSADDLNQKKKKYTDYQKGDKRREEEADRKKHEAEVRGKNHATRPIMSDIDSCVDDDETHATAKTTNKKDTKPSATLKKPAAFVSSTKLNLVPMTRHECQSALQAQMITYCEPEYLVAGSVEYDIARETITLEAMCPLDANKSFSNSEYKVSVIFGRNKVTNIKWSVISRDLCDVSLISRRFDQSAAFITMKKSAVEHAVCLNGRELNVPVGNKVSIEDSDILSLYGPAGFAYRVELSVLRHELRSPKGDE